MTDWLSRAASLVAEKTPAIMITVCGVEGSAPREPGARMIVSAHGQWGTIGGGNLEYSAIVRAREMLADGRGDPLVEDYPLGPAFGQCCGGRVRIGYERLGERDLDWLRSATDAIERGRTAVLERSFSESPGSPARTVREGGSTEGSGFSFVDRNGASITDPMPLIDDCAGFREIVADARARVYIFGAGHVGLAIAKILAMMPVRATLIDRRRERLPDGDMPIICSDRETEIARAAPAGAGYFVLTHSHDLDFSLVHEILTRSDSFYCGLIGSETKRARFERRLRRAGLSESELARLTCPIGANGLKSKSPESIALSAVHELLLAHESGARGP